MTIRFPYELQEGQIAFARHVMADLRAIVGGIENLQIEGFTTNDVVSMLAELMAKKVGKKEIGNADDVLFQDGYSMQQKLDSGVLNGRDGTAYDGYAYFKVNEDGELIVTVTKIDEEHNPYSINTDGELELALDDTGSWDGTVTYNLGNVRGPQGPQGPQGASGEASTAYTETVLAADSTGENPAAWNSDEDSPDYRMATIQCVGVTADNNFIVQPHVTGVVATDDAVASAWEAAMVRVVSQQSGQFTLYARGELPEINITIDIFCNV